MNKNVFERSLFAKEVWTSIQDLLIGILTSQLYWWAVLLRDPWFLHKSIWSVWQVISTAIIHFLKKR